MERKPSWATPSSAAPEVQINSVAVPQDATDGQKDGLKSPGWARLGSNEPPSGELKKSVDILHRRRQSFEVVEGDNSALIQQDGNLLPDQVGAFMRIADDQMRMQAMNYVISVLKKKIEERDVAYLKQCLSTVQRLALESAFASVRQAFSHVLDLIEGTNLLPVQSDVAVVTKWVKADALPSVQKSGDEDSLTSRLLRSIDVMEGRVPHIIVVLAWHPTFLEKWYRTTVHLMRGAGPLPFTWRRYISVVACARFQCMPLLKLQEMDFLTSGGDHSWLSKGIAAETLPSKLYALMELNGLLAHQPWLITPQKMEKLLAGPNKEATWSVAELVHALAIMVTFHSACGMVWGLGVRPEVDIAESLSSSLSSAVASMLKEQQHSSGDNMQAIQPGNFGENTSRIIDMLKTGNAHFSQQRQTWLESAGEKKSVIWASAEEPQEEFKKELISSSSILRDSSHAQYCARFIGPVVMEYSDFDITSTEYAIHYKAQYNWDNDGYALVHQFYDGLAPLLGAELQHIQSLTYNRFANEEVNIDTTAFRGAVWHYAHRIKGLLDDDYNYSEVNQLLNRQMKFYIKKITCFPQTLTMVDFLNLGYDLLPSEKCHIALLATEASKEASLTYALRALSQFLKRKKE